jgi:ATP phosphoribosyltransferase
VEEIMPISARLVINQAALKLKYDTIKPMLEAFSAAVKR